MIASSVEAVINAKKINDVVSVAPTATVAEAVAVMSKREMGAVIIRHGASSPVEGIFTERDLMRRVVGEGRDPKTTGIGTVMTPNVRKVSPAATIEEALRLMVVHGYRHLLVEEGGKVMGLVSIRDLMAALVLPDEPVAHEGRVGVIKARAEETVRSIKGMGPGGNA
jgi:CBS domain-containing protein